MLYFLNIAHILLTCMFLLPSEATATVELSTKRGLIKSGPRSICLLAVYLIRLWLCPLNLTAPLSLPLLRPLRGRGALRDTVRRVTRALTTGVTRGSSHFTEVQESHKASGGIYEGGGRAKGGWWWGEVGLRGGLGCCRCPYPVKSSQFRKKKGQARTRSQKTHIGVRIKVCLNKTHKPIRE